MKAKVILLLFCCLITLYALAQEKTHPFDQSEELGQVSWYRDYDQAMAIAKKEEKAVLILFQEVPGCMTCRNYGHHVLSHPLMVEAIEYLFVPLAIYNNKNGKDGEILKRYNEPSWNNPVVRIVDENGKNIVPRVAGNYSKKGLYLAMEEALEKQEKKIPEFMALLRQEIEAQENYETAYFQMYCFWRGESHLGHPNGVVATSPGFMNGAEVVKVRFNPHVISKSHLVKHAEAGNCSLVNKISEFRIDKDPQYYLKNSPYKYIPLTDIQKTKINSAIRNNKNPESFLAPSQLKWLHNLEKYNPKKRQWYSEEVNKGWTFFRKYDQ